MVKFILSSFLVLSVLISSVVAVYIPPTRGGDKCIVLSHLGEYSYNTLTNLNPYKWGENKEYEMCGKGHSQSPIDFPLQTVKRSMKNAPKSKFFKVKLELHSKIENWAIECHKHNNCGYTEYKGKKYYVHSIHFHTPSEHTLNGKQYPLESHLVHIAKDGSLAVVANMYDYPAERPYHKKIREYKTNKPKEHGMNYFIESILHQLMDQEKKVVHTNFKHLIKHGGSCAYSGSLTTPPCTQPVWFFMQMNVQTVAKQQVNLFHKSVGSPPDGINRPTQPLNMRKVTCYLPTAN